MNALKMQDLRAERRERFRTALVMIGAGLLRRTTEGGIRKEELGVGAARTGEVLRGGAECAEGGDGSTLLRQGYGGQALNGENEAEMGFVREGPVESEEQRRRRLLEDLAAEGDEMAAAALEEMGCEVRG